MKKIISLVLALSVVMTFSFTIPVSAKYIQATAEFEEYSTIDFESTAGVDSTTLKYEDAAAKATTGSVSEEVGTEAHGGTKVFKVNGNSATGKDYAIYFKMYNAFPVITSAMVDKTIKLSYWVKPVNPVGSATTISMKSFLISGSTFNQVGAAGTSKTVTIGEWTQVSFEFKITAAMVGLDRLRFEIGSNLVQNLYVDDFKTEFTGVGSKSDVLPYKTNDNFDSYSAKPSFVADGGQFSNVPAFNTDATFAKSGSNSIVKANRQNITGSIKFINLFGDDPYTEDIGKTFRISVWVYADKAAGGYSKNASCETYTTTYPEGSYISRADIKANYSYTQEQLSQMKPVLSIGMYAPGGYKYSSTPYNGTIATEMNWNEWTQLVVYHTITADTLSNGTGNNTDPLVNSIRIDQPSLSSTNPLVDTFYADDLEVEEVTAPTSSFTYSATINGTEFEDADAVKNAIKVTRKTYMTTGDYTDYYGMSTLALNTDYTVELNDGVASIKVDEQAYSLL